MKRVFLSYAREDQAVADRLARWLRDKGIEPYWFQNEEQRGRRFVGEMERAIAEADLFVVLLSPNFLTSAWCRHERDLALLREIDFGSDRQFIYVLKVAETSRPESGFLRSYDQLNATAPLTEGKLKAIGLALDLDAEPEEAGQSALRPTVVFRNRDDELDAVVNALTRSGGRDLWVIVSPPGMGKSWLLNQVHRSLMEKDSGWSERLVDVSEQPRELCTNAGRLLGTLLDVDVADPPDGEPIPDATLRRIAVTVSGRSRRQLYLLDSADRLDPVCAMHLRFAITEVYRRVQVGGNPATRLGMVIATRRPDEWRGLGSNPRYGLRFQPYSLTEFGVDVVHTALRELNWDHGSERRWDWAQELHRLSEGLPALLVRSLTWAVEHGFDDLTACSSDGVFDHVARPYISGDLLARKSLLPWRTDYERQSEHVLERTLQILATYRLFTLSHLRHHMELDASLQAALNEARWSRTDLWDALGRTSLCDQPVNELWQEIEPPIRRLLYRYYNRTGVDRVAAHVAARDFYLGWTPARTAGREQQVVLVECLWHEASRMVIVQPDDVADLPQVAANFAREFANSPIFEPGELRDFVVGRLRDDEEFQKLLQSYDGLFEMIVDAVARTIGGGP